MVLNFDAVAAWLSHNVWVVIIPFIKTNFSRLLALKLLVFLKSLGILFSNLFKLFLLKLFKTLGIRYGIFFSQYRWRWIRRAKVVFLRKGKLFFRAVTKFWSGYERWQQWVILIAFFPVGLLLFLLGLSFNLTRKTMVQKTQETAIFKTATTVSQSSRGIRAWIAKLDELTLKKIRAITTKVQKQTTSQQAATAKKLDHENPP